jgi:ATP-dependent helicase/nuclease subunit A
MSALKKATVTIDTTIWRAMHSPQIKASDPKASVSLLASAGAGKTTVLCERFLNLVASGTQADKILCLTYTKSAAKEMLERILQRALNTPWYEAIIAHKHHLKVQTLHSFCLDIIGRYAESMGGAQCKLLEPSRRLASLKHGIEAVMYSHDPMVSECVTGLAKHFTIRDIKNRLSRAICSYGGYLHDYFADKPIDPYDLKNSIFAKHDAEIEYKYEIECESILEYIRQHELSLYTAEQHPKLEALRNALIIGDYKTVLQACLTQERTVRKTLTEKMFKQYPALCGIIHNIQNLIYLNEQRFASYICAERNWQFIVILQKVWNQYRAFKEEYLCIDYDDIIYDATKLLQDHPYILYKLDYEIQHILVDEAQDLSAKQWDLIQRISSEFFAGEGARYDGGDKTIFLVGDIKQSIFGFQGASPELLKHYSKLFQEASDETGKWYDVGLNISYRSEPVIIDLVNIIFSSLIDDFPKHIAHKSGAGYVKVWPLLSNANPGDVSAKDEMWVMPAKELDVLDQDVLVAEHIAVMVNKWITESRVIESLGRQIRPSDVMILVRKRSEYVDILASKLRKLGLKVSMPAKGSILDSLVVQDIVALLKLQLHKDDDLNLSALLKSPWFCYSDIMLHELCVSRETDILTQLKVQDPSTYNQIEEMCHALSIHGTVYCYLHHLLFADLHIEQFVAFFGSDCLAQVDALLEAIYGYEASNPNANIRQILEYLENTSLPSDANISDEAVRIMTVHSAKGLQSQIVILADATAQGAGAHVGGVHFSLGELYFSAGSDYKSVTYKNIMLYENYRAEQEDMRLLYVALTRAQSEIHVFGSKQSAKPNTWYHLISQHAHVSPPWQERDVRSEGATALPSTEVVHIPYYVPKGVVSPEGDIATNLEVIIGQVIHAILEKLSVLTTPAQQMNYCRVLKHQYERAIGTEALAQLWQEAMQVYEHFPELFVASNSLSEQSIIVRIPHADHMSTSLKRIDKIIFRGEEIMVLDFKTDATVALTVSDVKRVYREQVAEYVSYMKALHPQKTVSGYILWTKSLKLMLIEQQ